ncbi:MAG: hypothetical protein HY551_04085 [Elusimicrobia bacterium]|nr:hypothetical protein [Elusimicrobiota bacterium]
MKIREAKKGGMFGALRTLGSCRCFPFLSLSVLSFSLSYLLPVPRASCEEPARRGFPWKLSGSFSLNWRNVGPRRPDFETQIQNEVYLADLFFAFDGPMHDGIPYVIEFQMPTGGQGQPSLYRFNIQYDKISHWNFQLGKFLVPFGRYNELYRPDMFLTVTRPLLYASPDSLDLVVRLNSPRPPFSSGYTDIGARASYYPPGDHRIWPNEATVFVVNGLSEASNRSRTFPRPDNLGVPGPPPNGISIDFGHENNNLADNNNNKAIGGRVVYALGSLDLPWPIPEGKRDLNGITFGVSAMGGQYNLEGTLNYTVLGFDMAFEYQGLNVAAEYMHSYTDFRSPLLSSTGTLLSPIQLATDYEAVQGYFVQTSYPLLRRPRWGKRLTGVAVYNQMFRRGPGLSLLLPPSPININGSNFTSVAAFDPNATRVGTRMDKLTLGFNFQVTDHIIWKYDYSYWSLVRATTQTGRRDVYQHTLSVVMGF